jgi:BirA family biotin operon repressor/biotin-[acetyl-CoA-carboxylase] ligase
MYIEESRLIHIHLDTIDSTSLYAKKLISIDSELKRILVTAKSQTSAYGRMGRVWQTLDDNLAMTYGFQQNLSDIFVYPFIAGLSVLRMLRDLNMQNVLLKWPNDILYKKKKISGILTEKTSWNGVDYIFIGIGLNVFSSPTNVDYETMCLHQANINIPPMLELYDNIVFYIDEFVKDIKKSGFESIKNEWIENAAFLNENIVVNIDGTQLTGIFNGINENGALQLLTLDGIKYISSCEIIAGYKNAVSN